MGLSPIKQAEPNCDIPVWPPGRTLGESPNGVQDFRSCGTQESPAPKRASPQHLSCPEIPSCSSLAPSAGASHLTLNPQPCPGSALPLSRSFRSDKIGAASPLVVAGYTGPGALPWSSCPHGAGSMQPAATWLAGRPLPACSLPVPTALPYASNFK